MRYARFSVCRIGLPLLFAATAAAWTAPALADMIDVSLNVFYADPMDDMSGGTWDLVARSDLSGIAGLSLQLTNIATAQPTGPRGTVNGVINSAGFSVFRHIPPISPGGIHNVIAGQAPLPNGQSEQTVFYGVGTLTNGSPNYAGQPMGTNSIGPMFTTLTDVLNVPWADTPDFLGESIWDTAARLATGNFNLGVTPAFASGSNGTIFTTTGTSTVYGVISDLIPLAPGGNAVVRTNYVAPMFHRADYNHDGTVNAADYPVWRNTLGSITILDADGSGPMGLPDGVIDIFDYEYWKANYGTVGPGAGSGAALGGATVPEPGTAWLLVAGLAWLALWRAGRPSHDPCCRAGSSSTPVCRAARGGPAFYPAGQARVGRAADARWGSQLFAAVMGNSPVPMKKATLEVETA